MSFNTLEAFNAKMADSEMANEYVCSDRQYTYINDGMSNSYNTGYLNFNSVQLVGADPNKSLGMSSAFVHMPYGAVVDIAEGDCSFGTKTTAGQVDTYTLEKNAAMLLAPKGNQHLFSSLDVRMGGVTIHQALGHANYYLNEQLKCMNTDQYRMFGDLINHEWDSHESYSLNKDTLETNNNIAGLGNFLAAGLSGENFANRGHLQRIYKNNVDLTTDVNRLGMASAANALKTGSGVVSANTLQNVFSPSIVGVYSTNATSGVITAITPTAAGVYASVEHPITTIVFQYIAIVPLSILSNFFKDMPTMNTLSNFELKLLTNLSPNNYWTVTFGNAAPKYTVTATGVSQAIGESCPFMLSPLSDDGTQGVTFTGNAPTLCVSPFIGYYNTAPPLVKSSVGKRVNQNSLLPCQIWIPSVNLTNPYMDMLLSNKTKRILYNDYQVENSITNITPYSQVQRLLTYQVSRLRKMYILPFLSPKSAADENKCCDPRQSLISSAPNTVSFSKISNLQVYLGSTNLFVQPQSHDFLHYLQGSYVQQGLLDGNDFKSMSMMGQIPYTAWKKCYGTYVVDLERVADDVTDEIIKNIQISFKNDTPNTYNYLIITEYQSEIEIDRVSGQIVR